MELWVACHDLMNVTNSGNSEFNNDIHEETVFFKYLGHFKPVLQTLERRQELREKGLQQGPPAGPPAGPPWGRCSSCRYPENLKPQEL